MFRKVFFGVLMILLLLAITGCEEKITPKVISELIFDKGIDHSEFLLNSQFRELSAEEIKIIEYSIKNGHGLSELTSNEVLSTNPVDYLQIIITKKNKSVVRINYNYELKYLLIPKIQVHAENSEKYKRSLSANRKYLDGTYKLYPSSEIEKLIASIKENG